MGAPDLQDPRTPTWPELLLDGHVSRVKASLALYFASLIAVWTLIISSTRVSQSVGNLVFYLAAANYLFLVWSAYRIQETLHESGLHEYAGWRVWVGALLLNPLLLGWWMPIRVLFIAKETREALEAQWPHGRASSGSAQP
jgi:hypothetical protein